MLKYVCILSAALLLGLCSCTVYDRGTGNYLDYPELTETNASIVEIATLSEEERRVRFERLKKLAEEPYPQYELDAGDVLNIKVYNHPDLETQTPVTPDGHVGMMFVGQVKVGAVRCRRLRRGSNRRWRLTSRIRWSAFRRCRSTPRA